jgi:hypothetical protein
MKESEELITPKLAEKYLNRNTSNRPLRTGHAEQMQADMEAGNWTYCNTSIAFYEDGSLADGQHRLWAIVNSGIARRFRIVRDLPRAQAANIDTNVPRTAVDVARIHGIDPEVSNAIAAIARGIEEGQPSQKLLRKRTITESLVIIAKHRAAAHWVSKNIPPARGMHNAAVLSAIGRAYYVEKEKERLAFFGKVLAKGFVETNDDTAAVALRNYLLNKLQKKMTPSDSQNWRDTFLKTQNAIFNFMRHKPLTIIKPVADESYPLAERTDTIVPQTKAGVARANRAKKSAGKKVRKSASDRRAAAA